jgi:hypothetical protein
MNELGRFSMVDIKRAVAIFIALLFILFFALSAFPSSAREQEEMNRPPDLDAKMRAEVVKGVGELLQKLYIFPDKAREMDARGQKIKLIPLSPTYFVPGDDSEIQVEFVLDKEGEEYEIIGHFRDGETQHLSRIKEKK